MSARPLGVDESEEIYAQLEIDREVSWAEIARVIERHPCTVAREVERNGGRYRYRPSKADRRAKSKRRRPKARRLSSCRHRERIRAELEAGRSPYAIATTLRAEGHADAACAETIYVSTYDGTLGVKARHCLRSRRARRRPRQAREQPANREVPTIHTRPAVVDDRSQAGHWELDLIVGARNRSAMLTLCERQSRYLAATVLPAGYWREPMIGGFVHALGDIPAHLRRSLTFDRGTEWSIWADLAEHYQLDVWFCDPHSPWQRGQIENANRQLRWWFPRGTDLSIVTQAEADHACSILNHQPRRLFAGDTPANRYADLTAP